MKIKGKQTCKQEIDKMHLFVRKYTHPCVYITHFVREFIKLIISMNIL